MAGPPSSSVLLCPLYRCASMNPQRSGGGEGGGGEGELKDSTKETREESTGEVSRIFGLCVYIVQRLMNQIRRFQKYKNIFSLRDENLRFL
jgi:hypothetical protein